MFRVEDLIEYEIDRKPSPKLHALRGVTREEVIAHEMKHRRFEATQQYQQPELEDGDILALCDFSQLMPKTRVATGVKKLTFDRCRLENCVLPKDAKLKNCKPTQKSYCSHINPRLPLPPCPIVCRHVVKHVPEIVVEGRVVLRDVYHRLNKDL
jgi:hypothetical protein